MKKELYDIILNERDFFLIMLALENQLCKISTIKKQDRKKLNQEYYKKQEILINRLMNYLYECTTNKKELDANLETFLKEC